MKYKIKIKGDNIGLTKLNEVQDQFQEQEIEDWMKLSEHSLNEFLSNEPDLYTDADLKVKYK